MEARARVNVLDDDASVVVALRRMLESEPFEVRTWTSASKFLAEPDPGRPTCLVCDLVMPEMNGLDLQRALQARGDCPSIVFVTAQGALPSVVQGMRAGAVTFLSKPVLRDELVSAIQEGLKCDAAARAGREARQVLESRLSRLSTRESEVLALVISGLRNKQVGAILGITEKTVKAHRAAVMRKMEARSLAELVSSLGEDPLRQRPKPAPRALPSRPVLISRRA